MKAKTAYRLPLTAYRLGLNLAYSVAFLTALTMLTGCANDHDPIVPEGKPISELRQEMKQLAKSVSAELKSQQPASARDGNRSETCNCSYEILSGSAIVDPKFPYLEIDFYSDECNPPIPCLFFSANYFSGESCLQTPVCGEGSYDLWSQFPPVGVYPFFCDVSPYQNFTAFLNSVNYSSCYQAIQNYSSITFRIHCVETCGELSFPVVSDPITLTFNGGLGPTPPVAEWSETISMGGCGCTPQLSQ